MIEIAKLDENNRVTNTFTVHKAYVVNSARVVTQEKVTSYCNRTYGSGTYVANTDAVNGQADIGKYYSADYNSSGQAVFYEERPTDMNGNPCTSWTVNMLMVNGVLLISILPKIDKLMVVSNGMKQTKDGYLKSFQNIKNDSEIWYEYNPGGQTWSTL